MQFKPFYCTQEQLIANIDTIAQPGRLIVCEDSKAIYFCSTAGTATLIGAANEATISKAGLMTAAMVSKLDGIAAEATANSPSNTSPKMAGVASVGIETDYARGDHVHPIQTTVSGNAGSADKLSSDKTFILSGDVSGTVTSDLSNGFSMTNTTIKTMIGYGICTTSNNVAAKIVSINDANWKREVGSLVAVNFTNSNTANNVTLNVNGTGAAGIIYDALTTAYTGSSPDYCGHEKRTTLYMWNGTYWVFITNNSVENDNIYTSAYCSTSAGTLEKTAIMTGYKLLDNSYVYITMANINTAAGAITLNINDEGAKPVYINGTPSNNTNYNLPAGSYIIYYDGANYHFRTDGKIPGMALSAEYATSATTASKLSNTVEIGSSTKPVYFTAEGIPAEVSDTGIDISITGSSGSCTGNAATATTATQVGNKLTFTDGGGAASGVEFNGSAAQTISYNTLGAAAQNHIHAITDVTDLQTSLDNKINTNKIGVADGIASLDNTGKVPSFQLPSYVDDVVEGYLHNNKFYSTRLGDSPNFSYSAEIAEETGKIYVDLATNKTYRYGGSSSGFVEISESLALGEVSTTAYYGDKGHELYTNYGTGVDKGTSTTPIYINNGVPTPCNDTLDNNINGNAQTATVASKLGTETVGNNVKPIYLNSGEPVAFSDSVGSITKPVYLNSGTITPLDMEIRSYNGSLFSEGWNALGGTSSWKGICTAYNNNAPEWLSNTHSSTLVFGGDTAKGYIDTGHQTASFTVGEGDISNSTSDAPNWYMKFSGTDGKTYTLPTDSKTLAASDGTNASGTGWDISITGNANTATSLDSDRLFSLNGDVTGLVSSNLSSGLNITTTSNRIVGYGICLTESTEVDKVVSITNEKWTREVGSVVGIKFFNTNSRNASNVTLNINDTGAANIWYNTSVYTGSSSDVCGHENRYNYYMWDGTYWVWLGHSFDANDDTYTSAYCSTESENAVKTATMTEFTLKNPCYVHITLTNSNSAQSLLKLNINDTGEEDIYINGVISSNLNYTLPAGSYIVYYDGTGYYFRTDEYLHGAISATKLTTIAAGSPTQPVYFENGVPVSLTGDIENNTTGSAAKLTTERAISLGTGVTSVATNFDGSSDITIPVTGIKESYLTWGGKTSAGEGSPIDAAMIGSLGANRFAFGNPDGVTIEYSRDTGATWNDYEYDYTNYLFIEEYFHKGITIGKNNQLGYLNRSGGDSTKQVRVTLNMNDFGYNGWLNKFAFNVGFNGSTDCWCSIDISPNIDSTTWVNIVNQIALEEGWNIINVDKFETEGNDGYGKVRFTFGCDGVPTDTFYGLTIFSILGYGSGGYLRPSNMADTGHLYMYDDEQNAQFPNIVSAELFKGLLEGNATSATGLETGRTLTIGNIGKTFDGTEDVDWTLDEIGVLPLTGGTLSGGLTVNSTVTATNTIKSNTQLQVGNLAWVKEADGSYSLTMIES